ncbi:ABC transporter permease [uncultured Winogradskyella sp.]|uniref:ABC transporter permease n=1 Tax=uncultured Winogradskyella sp. TaxID=395353 RepID=UPI00260B2AE9|nr:ABC transporter permease [uncultured Winogradskyella sp.]
MIKNYFKIAWRNIMRNKVFSFINIIGLTIGLSASFVIGLMIYYDYTFDNFHKDGDRIYRIVTDFKAPEGEFYNSGVTIALEDAINSNINFELVSGFYIERPSKVENKENDIEVKWPNHVIYTNEDYFNLFDYKFIAGHKSDALSKPNSVILTKARAALYFPKMLPSEIIGKTLVYNDSINISVRGIVENFKQQSDFVFQEFISHPTILQTRLREDFQNKNWNNTNSASQLYVKISENGNLNEIQKQLDALALEHLDEEAIKYNQSRQFVLQPLRDIHFNDKYGIYDWTQGQASKSLLRNLALIAIFLLLLGCVNFINLNTAQATQRAKEIGVRKTLGGSKKQLIVQFMGETFLLVVISSVLSLILSRWLISIFSDFVPQGLSFELFKAPLVISGILVLLLIVTLLSGFYPAFMLSKFNPVSVLKNQIVVNGNKAKLRKVLTVFQFTIAQVFIIATLLVGKQINYLLNKDMGFKTDAIISVYSPRSETELSKKELYTQKLKAIPQIKGLSIGGNPPASFSTNSTNATFIDGEKEIQTGLQFIHGDTNYLNVFELNLLAGRTRRNDTVKELVVNETFAKKIGFLNPIDAVGNSVILSDENVPIVGVMADFHQRSLRTGIEPMALIGDWYRPRFSQFQAVHMSLKSESSENLRMTLKKIENEYKSVYTEVEDFRLVFMDETVQQFYNREEKVSRLLNWATGLSILISCLGLFGLVIYTTNRRVKEIGVRKVLGASLLQINTLLCKEFLTLVAIAFIIAIPIAWYGISNWLQDFAYKTSIGFWVFLISGCAMLLFALIVISIKTLQAANANPVNSLRSE